MKTEASNYTTGQNRAGTTRVFQTKLKHKIRMYPSGLRVDPLDLSADDITIEDIAHHLSRICRFNGGVPSFYSVAEHSLRVAQKVDRRHAKWAMLHDAAEAYLGDITRPIKSRLFYNGFTGDDGSIDPVPANTIEMEILEIIGKKFDLCWPIPDEIWKADDIRLAEELELIEDHKLHGNLPNLCERRFLDAWKNIQSWT